MTEVSATAKTLKVSVSGSEPVILHLDSAGAATLRLEVTVTGPDVTGYTYTEPVRSARNASPEATKRGK